MAKLTKRKLDAEIQNISKETRLWDEDPRGFGVRIKSTGVASFFIQYQGPNTHKKTRYTIDQYGRLTIEQARTKAKELFQKIANGVDPAIEAKRSKYEAVHAITVADFCDDYLKDARAGIATFRGRPKKESTLAIDHGRIERHIKPTIGHLFVREVTTKDIERAMHDIRQGKTAADIKTGPRGRAIVKGGAGTAARCVAFMSAIFSYAIKQGIRTDNPVSGIELPPPKSRDRVLSPREYRALGDAINSLKKEGGNPIALRAYRLLALTGCRKSEIFTLKKSEADEHHQCLRLEDTKTGSQVRPVGKIAIEILQLPEFNKKSDYVFPSSNGESHLSDAKLFKKVVELAKLSNVTLHTLRHSYASVALELEYSEMTVAGLLGHRSFTITSRYTHHVDRALVDAANRISAEINYRLDGNSQTPDNVVKITGRAI